MSIGFARRHQALAAQRVANSFAWGDIDRHGPPSSPGDPGTASQRDGTVGVSAVDWAGAELVAGEARAPAVAMAHALEDPNDGRSLGPARASDAARIEAALAAAATSDWPRRSLDEGAALERFADALHARAEAIAMADAIDSEVPIATPRRSRDRWATSCARRSPRRRAPRSADSS